MATCLKCGAKMGCGCQLTNGLCAACYSASKKVVKRLRNAITKTFGLYRMF